MTPKSVANENTILAVEDDPELGEMLQTYFRDRGYETALLASGEEALQWVQETEPNVILLDIHLPGIDGFELCRQLRRDHRFRHTPVIFLTERRAQDDRLAGLALGAVDYLSKPFDIQELGLRVRNALARATMVYPTNPVTGLPQSSVTGDWLADTLKRSEWSIVVAGLSGMRDFSETYGFVVADDVARASGLMIQQVVEGAGGSEFLGHLDAAEFVIVTSAAKAGPIAEQCRQRLAANIPYFYPATDWKALQESSDRQRLTAHASTFTSANGSIATLEEFLQAVQSAL